jgi:hypothetical protein
VQVFEYGVHHASFQLEKRNVSAVEDVRAWRK